MPRRDRPGRSRAATEVQRRHRVRRQGQRRLLDVDVLALERHGLAGPQPADDLEELVAALVPRVLVEVIAERPLLVGLAADDDVEQDAARERAGRTSPPSAADSVGLTRPGPERHQEGQRGGLPRQQRGGDEGVLAPRAGGDQRAGEPECLCGPHDRGQIVDRRVPVAVRNPGRCAVAAADDQPAVAVGGKEPVQLDGHGCVP